MPRSMKFAKPATTKGKSATVNTVTKGKVKVAPKATKTEPAPAVAKSKTWTTPKPLGIKATNKGVLVFGIPLVVIKDGTAFLNPEMVNAKKPVTVDPAPKTAEGWAAWVIECLSDKDSPLHAAAAKASKR